jgi:RNA polymerase sigma factor FliA
MSHLLKSQTIRINAMALDDPTPQTFYDRRARAQSNDLVLSHQRLVRKIAWHVHGRVSSAIDIADLMQIGMVALVEAAQAYEDRGHSFSTYATLRIRGAMIDELRRTATIGRAAMANARRIAAARKAIEDREGRPASDAELAAALTLSVAEYRTLAAEAQSIRQDSIDELYSDHSLWFADDAPAADEAMDRQRLAALLADGIRALPEREAMVLQLYFTEELNLQEIGETLGIGAARVCQIKKVALERLKAGLGDRV